LQVHPESYNQNSSSFSFSHGRICLVFPNAEALPELNPGALFLLGYHNSHLHTKNLLQILSVTEDMHGKYNTKTEVIGEEATVR